MRQPRVVKRGNAQGTIYQRSNGRWVWQATLGFDQNGKQIRRSGTAVTKTEANTVLAKVISEHDSGRLTVPNKITVGEWLERWLEERKPSLATNTHSSYTWLIGKHVNPWIGHLRLQTLRPTELRHFYSRLAAKEGRNGRKLSPRTLRYIHGLIYSALKDALQLEIVERNVAEVVKPLVPNEDRAIDTTQSWNAEETALFLDTNRNELLYALFALMLALGLRRGEALGLRWEHINLERRVIRIVETLIVVRGKVMSGKPKTRKSQRTLRLAPGLCDVLQLHRTATEAALEQNGVTTERDWVFVTSQGTPIHPDNVERTLKRLAKQAGVRSIRVHDLRHTYASLARRQGVSLEIVSEKLGHSRPSFTADVYRHTFEDEHESATLELSELTSMRNSRESPEQEASKKLRSRNLSQKLT